MELDSRKKSKCNRMIRSKSFETVEVREIGWKEAGESRSFSILWIGITKDVFQMKGKECKDQERLKMCRRKSMPERGRCFNMGLATLPGPVAVNEERCCTIIWFCANNSSFCSVKRALNINSLSFLTFAINCTFTKVL